MASGIRARGWEGAPVAIGAELFVALHGCVRRPGAKVDNSRPTRFGRLCPKDDAGWLAV